MGKFNQGILGGFTGKVGNVVGARSRGEWIYRAYQGVVKNPKTIGQTKQREQFRIFSQEIAKVCKAERPMFDSAFPKGMTYQSFLVNVCFNMLRAYQKYPKKPFESLKNVGLSNAIGNIGGLINYTTTSAPGAKAEAPVFGSPGDVSGEKFYGLNFNGDLNYYNNVIKNQGTLGEQMKLFAMWLSKGADGFFHISIAVGGGLGTTGGIATTNTISTEIRGVAQCKWFNTSAETEAWAWVKANVNVPDNWQMVFSSVPNHFMADEDDGGNLLNKIPLYYHWFVNSNKIPLGSICKLIDIERAE